MLGIDYRAARSTWTAALILLGLGALYVIRGTVLVFVIALLFAYMLYPFMALVDRHLHGKTRTPALAITFIVVMGILVSFAVTVGSVVANEAASLAAQAPAFLDRLRQSPPPGPSAVTSLRAQILGWIEDQLRQHSNDIAMLVPRVAIRALSASRNLIYLILIPILSFLLLRDGKAMLAALLEMLEPLSAAKDALSDVHELLLLYMRALLFLCCVTLVSFSVILSVMQVPYAMLLASIAFALEFIPMVGPLTAAVVIVAVSIITGYGHVWWIIVFLAVFRLIQDYVISPMLMGRGIQLHPLMIILGVLAGGEIGGVAGVFLSVPVLAMIRLFYHRFRKARAAEALTVAE